eukprot:COSAG03_NODE_488_length_7495_cov_1.792455_6_plen_51_part_00
MLTVRFVSADDGHGLTWAVSPWSGKYIVSVSFAALADAISRPWILMMCHV